MRATSQQMVKWNDTTLKQWCNCRVKTQDDRLVLQGINLPSWIPMAVEALPPATVCTAFTSQLPRDAHMYTLPQITAGQAVTTRKATVVPSDASTAVPL